MIASLQCCGVGLRRWATLHAAGGFVLAFQRVEDHRPPRWPDPAHPQQFHLDLGVEDLDRAQRDVLLRGRTLLDEGDGKRSWRVFADPEASRGGVTAPGDASG